MIAAIHIVLKVLVASNLLCSIFSSLCYEVKGVLLLNLLLLFLRLNISTWNICPQGDFIDVLAQEWVHIRLVGLGLQNLHNLVLLIVYATLPLKLLWNRNVYKVSNFWLHLVNVLPNHSGVVIDDTSPYPAHYPNAAMFVLLN